PPEYAGDRPMRPVLLSLGVAGGPLVLAGTGPGVVPMPTARPTSGQAVLVDAPAILGWGKGRVAGALGEPKAVAGVPAGGVHGLPRGGTDWRYPGEVYDIDVYFAGRAAAVVVLYMAPYAPLTPRLDAFRAVR